MLLERLLDRLELLVVAGLAEERVAFDEVLDERVDAGAQAGHDALPLAGVDVELVADEAGVRVLARVDGVHGASRHRLVDRVVEQLAQHAELEQQRARARRARVVVRLARHAVLQVDLFF